MKIDNVEIMGLESSIIASGYPMRVNLEEQINEKQIKRCINLCNAQRTNRAHEQFLTGVRVNFDLTCTNKMWVEAERYRFLEFVSQQSTMHRITKFDIKKQCNKYVDDRIIDIVKEKVDKYNYAQRDDIKEMCLKNPQNEYYNNIEKYNNMLNNLYLDVLYNVPSGFEITARMTTNYRCLKNMYLQRKNHRLPEWKEFCKWVETLPYFNEFLIYEKDKEDKQ